MNHWKPTLTRSIVGPSTARRGRDFGIDPDMIRRRDELTCISGPFWSSQDEIAVGAEREMKRAQDTSLCVNVEVHERVAAQHDVHPAKGRIRQQVVCSKDNVLAQVR